ncbi:hypothetical protein [Paenibacillus sp. NPDC058174]|uniref:hypothetical protein n=1 Tax=Paenibacillus sp. NPDC058174 TaxID=3346366 RepID=UPI0036DDA03C
MGGFQLFSIRNNRISERGLKIHMTHSFNYKLTFKGLPMGITNSGKNHKEYIYDLLNNIQSTLGTFELHRNNLSIQLSLDWSRAITAIKTNVEKNFFIDEIYVEFEKYKDQYHSIYEFFETLCEEIPNETEIIMLVSTSEVNMPVIEQMIKNFIYNLFLALNLSYPGLLDCFQARLDFSDDSQNLKLSNYEFEKCWTDETWPVIQYIPINKVCNWFNENNIWNKFVGESRLDKCLFSILHFCEDDKISPSKIVWLAHALESIYEIPQSGILNSLKERISIILFDNYEEKRSSIIKKIKQFYQYRSNFVHGSLTIHTPSEELIDSDIHQDYLELLFQTEEFAFRILVATLQQMIIKNWSSFNFRTTFEGF